jgi:hypothetical protein
MNHRFAALTAVSISLAASAALASPPPDADPSLAPWFNSLMDPQTSRSCCGAADCRPTENRIRDDHYEVFVENEWVTVPANKVLKRSDNPTGQAVLCWSKTIGVLCFVPGTGT